MFEINSNETASPQGPAIPNLLWAGIPVALNRNRSSPAGRRESDSNLFKSWVIAAVLSPRSGCCASQRAIPARIDPAFSSGLRSGSRGFVCRPSRAGVALGQALIARQGFVQDELQRGVMQFLEDRFDSGLLTAREIKLLS